MGTTAGECLLPSFCRCDSEDGSKNEGIRHRMMMKELQWLKLAEMSKASSLTWVWDQASIMSGGSAFIRNGWWCWIYRRSSGRSQWPGRVHLRSHRHKGMWPSLCGHTWTSSHCEGVHMGAEGSYGHRVVIGHFCQHAKHLLSEEKCYENVTLCKAACKVDGLLMLYQVSQRLWGCNRGTAQVYQEKNEWGRSTWVCEVQSPVWLTSSCQVA